MLRIARAACRAKLGSGTCNWGQSRSSCQPDAEQYECNWTECDVPLLRPLITMEKNEIIRIARQIGTFDTSILPFEDCCTLFVPKSPSTNPNLKVVERAEASIPGLDDMIDEAVAMQRLSR